MKVTIHMDDYNPNDGRNFNYLDGNKNRDIFKKREKNSENTITVIGIIIETRTKKEKETK